MSNPDTTSDAQANVLPDPTAFAAGGTPKRRRRRGGHDDSKATDVNINSLLDVLSVILVFLMKSYSANTVQIKPSADLQVPISWSSQAVQESTAITITLKDILVDDAPVMALDNGHVSDSDKSSGGLNIDPLFQKLQEAVDHQRRIAQVNKKAEFNGMVTIIADRNVPYALLSEVMYTAGQAQFSQFKFAAIKSER
jgi:biopolymer transport protein ExbD